MTEELEIRFCPIMTSYHNKNKKEETSFREGTPVQEETSKEGEERIKANGNEGNQGNREGKVKRTYLEKMKKLNIDFNFRLKVYQCNHCSRRLATKLGLRNHINSKCGCWAMPTRWYQMEVSDSQNFGTGT